MKYIVNIEGKSKIQECAIIKISTGYRQNHITITDRNGFNRKVFRSFDNAVKYLCGDNGEIKILKSTVATTMEELTQRILTLFKLAGFAV